ncbi:KUP/HAK/KT family potassium transporter [Dyadobacter chenhuakuii]|uniref:Probable potassium transport system protein Kup n=1 Tax=Dyadobacter chenhuakuii TaxID=2909339 RepID=A0A9X1QEH7_9BACT|nr:KUP/HAK/KT family potassium transporter [Dyadobacter chenhuakuii]MCF2492957.1 KUP/HAK/KT family potassium transporter [Dyadobacter chenhuakuii]MCF2499017.1 KUP/HAK/KT family potassium transporter [Dyadobacter chenhuakuii]USJ32754.1 KUP/HAK/KT family potassium transporter [Dyadobacter chenhuakuii]
MSLKHSDKASAAGLLVALGIIFGDIGTSPLYAMQAIIGGEAIALDVVYGSVSCIFWTLTLQTTVKYVILILRADNNGEGGILALYALVRKNAKWLTIPAIIGASTLLADGIITPPISVSSAVEGLRILYPHIQTIPIVIGILTLLFIIQVFGTTIVGRAFGPVMLVWFLMLLVLGLSQVLYHPEIFKAFNPYYAYQLLANHPGGFWLLGSVFLCTTGAEALYSDLGHCGRGNIRISWIYVKTCLVINYFGQGAWLAMHVGETLNGRKPFYEIMPDWWLLPGICVATMATIIASQALISGSFTLVSEAIRLNLWPKVRLIYPSDQKGQLYVPSVNWLLWAGCIGIVLYFKESSHMEAAYGLAITLTMIMTTLLFSYYLFVHKIAKLWVGAFMVVYLAIEGSFLAANLLKFPHGGWVSLVLAIVIADLMAMWLRANVIKLRLTEFVDLDKYIPALKELSNDISVPKYATHLVFMSNAAADDQIENKIIYSIFQKRPKRADIYWFVHVETTDEPYTMDYHVNVRAEDDVIKINFILGFRVEQRINMFLRNVVQDMVRNNEVDITSRYESLNRQNVTGDFRFVVLERYLSVENDLPWHEEFVMKFYFAIKSITNSEAQWFGLDNSSVKVEKVPLVISSSSQIRMRRVY